MPAISAIWLLRLLSVAIDGLLLLRKEGLGMKPNDLFTNSVLDRDVARAKEGDSDATIRAGYLYLTGNGGMIDLEKACSYFQSSMPDSTAISLFVFSQLADPKVRKGKPYRDTCLQSLKEIAQIGDLVGQTLLGQIYEQGWGIVKVDRKAAKALYEEAASEFALAGTYLGKMYVTEGRIEEAIKVYTEAALAGELESMVDLGDIYLMTQPVQYARGMRMLRCAAERGSLRARYRLGVLYFINGMKLSGGTEAVQRAFRLFQLSSMGGYKLAAVALGTCYAQGHGVERDEKQALRWLKQGSKLIDRVAGEMQVQKSDIKDYLAAREPKKEKE